MARTDANPPMPEWSDEYQLVEVDADYLAKAVKPKQFIHMDRSECIMCEGCVDICPWKCIHMVTPDAIAEAVGTERPGADPSDHVIFAIAFLFFRHGSEVTEGDIEKPYRRTFFKSFLGRRYRDMMEEGGHWTMERGF